MMSDLASFAFIGIKDLTFRKRGQSAIEAHLKHLVDINLSDETAVDYLRGGYNNPKLLTIYGDRDCKVEGNTATASTELLKIMTNNTTKVVTENRQKIETLDIVGGKFTLSETPVSDPGIQVYNIVNGKKVTPALVVGSPTTNATDYSITGKEITCHSTVTQIVVYYYYSVEVETIEASGNTPKNYEVEGLLVAKEIETGDLLKVWLYAPNATIQPSFKLQAKNEASAPDAVGISIDMLMDDAKGYPYKLSFVREA